MTNLFVFGLGYSATEIARHARNLGWSVAGTVRDPAKAGPLAEAGLDPVIFTGGDMPGAIVDRLDRADQILVSIPPGEAGDPVIGGVARYLAAGGHCPDRITYLSSLSVYGDFAGAWIDEDAVTNPTSERGQIRLKAEAGWQELGAQHTIAVDILRLAGIYGPGRNTLLRLRAGTARRIAGTGQVFNRIHVEDVVRIAGALMRRSVGENGVFNICDNAPASQEDVILFAANMLGVEPPPANPLDEAGLSPLGRSFFEEHKKVRNRRVLAATGFELVYPTYREGLTALAGRGSSQGIGLS